MYQINEHAPVSAGLHAALSWLKILNRHFTEITHKR